MTTENQNTQISKSTASEVNSKMSAKNENKFEDRKAMAVKPLSLRPNRSVKKNTSLKPLGLRAR